MLSLVSGILNDIIDHLCFNPRTSSIFLRKPTLSQRLTELAQRVDFSDRTGDEDSEPAAKKTPQRWPWEVANSKLRYCWLSYCL